MEGLLGGMRVLDLSVVAADAARHPDPRRPRRRGAEGRAARRRPDAGVPRDLRVRRARGQAQHRARPADRRRPGPRATTSRPQADVVCEGWRPGVADRLGVGYEAVARDEPDVIYCSLSGYGAGRAAARPAGPRRELPGARRRARAAATASAPEVPRLPVADLEGGTVCALLDLRGVGPPAHDRRGERIDVAMADVVAWWVGPRSAPRTPTRPAAPSARPATACSAPATASGSRSACSASRGSGTRSAGALGLDDLLGGRLRRPARARRRDQRADRDTVRARLDLDDALSRLEAQGAPASPVLPPEQATDHPQIRARGFHVETDAGKVAALPARLDLGVASPRPGSPR